MAPPEILHRRDDLVELMQVRDGRPQHGHQLVLLLLEIRREQRAQVGRDLEQAPVEEVGRLLDDVRIGLERADAQQPVVMRRLLLGRDAEPHAIRVEIFRHVLSLAAVALLCAPALWGPV